MIKNSERDKSVWVFNAGNAFEGNPKWLFLYIVNYRKDIKPYWLCYKKELVTYMTNLGYNAMLYQSATARAIGSKAGVYVVNQVKEVIQDYLEGITILNLWHGVGCKTVERGLTSGALNERIAKKYITNNAIYQKYQLFLVTSPMMEKHFIGQCALTEDKLIRAGYPCNVYPDRVKTYDHDILSARNLPDDCKIVVYAPTYRDDDFEGLFLKKAFPDMDKLIRTLEQNNILLIYKLHPLMESSPYYHDIEQQYRNCNRIMFWNKLNDFYEFFYRIDCAIIDYSSILYDMIAQGVRHFIRYIDFEEQNTMRDFAFDYLDNSCGRIARNFNELLEALGSFDTSDESEEIEAINEKFWKYSTKDSFEVLIDRAVRFIPDEDKELPVLYSFDVFDTLISRTTSKPSDIFLYVQDQIKTGEVSFPQYFMDNYYKIRDWSESNCREFYNKTLEKRETTEISFDMIFDRIRNIYKLDDRQIDFLKEKELEAEYLSVTPISENIDKVVELVSSGKDVVLISDMYLDKQYVIKLLTKADNRLTNIPLYLSSDWGVQKTKKSLFLAVYHDIDYKYGEWIHTGDNQLADIDNPSMLGIHTHQVEQLKYSRYASAITSFSRTYDMSEVQRLIGSFEATHENVRERFAYSYSSLLFVPYIDWAIEDAISKGFDCLYFISRDGHYLKLIADEVIKRRNLPIKTKYIYGSRKLWRVPSMISEVDEEFFGNYGNFNNVSSFNQLLEAACTTEEEFLDMFPQYDNLKREKKISKDQLNNIVSIISSSLKYREFLLEKAKENRKLVLKYLKQEIDVGEKYAFVEYWGRGYTQTCLARLLWELVGEEIDVVFYYSRSIYPSEGHIIRNNYVTNNYSMVYIESIFANLPYRSVENYIDGNEIVQAEIKPCECDDELYNALEKYLPRFANDFINLNLLDLEGTRRTLYDFSLSYFHRNKTDPLFSEVLSKLYDSPSIYGSRTEYAPPIRMIDVIKRIGGERMKTTDMRLSAERSGFVFKNLYKYYMKFKNKRGKH